MVLSFDSDAAKWKYRDKPIATKRSHKPFEFQKKDAKWVDWNIRDVVTGLAQAVLLQRLLRPLHDWAMDVLRRLPCDGTFDQPKPLIRLTGRSIVSSCDLTAATDRWPYQLISQLVESWFGRGIATAAIDTCLVSNSIHRLHTCHFRGKERYSSYVVSLRYRSFGLVTIYLPSCFRGNVRSSPYVRSEESSIKGIRVDF